MRHWEVGEDMKTILVCGSDVGAVATACCVARRSHGGRQSAVSRAPARPSAPPPLTTCRSTRELEMESMMQSARGVLGMPGRITTAIIVSLSVPAGLFLALGPVAYAKPAKSSGTGHVEETKAEPTALAISLQGGEQSGPNITVPDRTPVRAGVTLTGTNAPGARGAVSYAVYSDSACTNEVAWAGPRLIRQSTESPPVRLRPGPYYWQASYGGDAKDLPSVSECAAAMETVDGTNPVPTCTSVAGEIRLDTEEGHLVVKDDLSSDLGAAQRLVASWSGKHHLRLTRLLGVACVAGRGASHFHGVGEARVDGEPGYHVRFNIRVSNNGEEMVHIHVTNARRERVVELTGSPAAGSEVIG